MHSKLVMESLQTKVCDYWQHNFRTVSVSWGKTDPAYQIYTKV